MLSLRDSMAWGLGWHWVMLSQRYLGLVRGWSLADAVCVMAEGHSRVNQGRQERCRSAENRTDVVVKFRTNGEHRAGLFSRELRSEPWFLLLSGPGAWTLSATGGTHIHTEYFCSLSPCWSPFAPLTSRFPRFKSNMSWGQRINC